MCGKARFTDLTFCMDTSAKAPHSAHAISENHLLDDDDLDLRAQRVWLILKVVFATWAFFMVFLYLRGYVLAACACLVHLCIGTLIKIYFYRSREYCKLWNIHMLSSSTGIFLVATSHIDLEPTIYFFPIAITVASQLFGIRESTYWFFATLVHFTIYYTTVYGVSSTFTEHLEGYLLSVGIAACAYFCGQQAEAHYRRKTQSLIDLSVSLRKKGKVLHNLATTDSLTSLTNRFQFQNVLADEIQSVADDKLLLFLIDMDGFKEVNDSMGHASGDSILIEIGRRLKDRFADQAIVSRLGGDEFCILFVGKNYVDNANAIGIEIHELLTARFVSKELNVSLGASIGYALCPDDADNQDELLSFADTAMYQAKRNRSKIARYQPAMTEELKRTRALNDRLDGALERNEFHLVFQPQIDIATKKIIGAEALLRWLHNGEVISPTRFVPLLELSGKIVDVGDWVTREACRQLSEWKQRGLDIRLAVNISAIQFQEPCFVKNLTTQLEEFQIDPSRLELEITEGVLVENVDVVTRKLQKMNQLGVRISVDDFGTGYSSLSYLKQFPIDKLKIDRAFVKDMPHADDGVIASSIIALSDALGITVIAEGVETQAQLDLLSEFGCEQYQGFFYSRPVSAEEIAQLLEKEGDTDQALSQSYLR